MDHLDLTFMCFTFRRCPVIFCGDISLIFKASIMLLLCPFHISEFLWCTFNYSPMILTFLAFSIMTKSWSYLLYVFGFLTLSEKIFLVHKCTGSFNWLYVNFHAGIISSDNLKPVLPLVCLCCPGAGLGSSSNETNLLFAFQSGFVVVLATCPCNSDEPQN